MLNLKKFQRIIASTSSTGVWSKDNLWSGAVSPGRDGDHGMERMDNKLILKQQKRGMMRREQSEEEQAHGKWENGRVARIDRAKAFCWKNYWLEFITRLHHLFGFSAILQKPAVCNSLQYRTRRRAHLIATISIRSLTIDVKRFLRLFNFKIKLFFIFPTFFINKKRWPTVPAVTICS